jgi:cysteinyl-tRNA synthetase
MENPRPKLTFYNSLTRSPEEFVPLSEGQVTLYTCGPTVYDSSHIGHARSFIVWDVLVRYMRSIDYNLQWARNITDVDDKIINRAKLSGINPEQLARQETYKFWRDMSALNIQWPDYEPRATENLPEMYAFIGGLIEKGFAYKASNGDVYFAVGKFKDYGQLKNLGEEKIARIAHLDCKASNCDFALWKACSKDEYGFESPFSYGRPGWHLECSSMIKRYFGETIDIHGGGEDLIFPHHENEIAQSEALHSKKFARYWLHNGMIMVDGKKMSKSEGNFVTIEGALKKFSGNAIRLFVLSAHYRQPINYTETALEAAESGVSKLLFVVNNFKSTQEPTDQEALKSFQEALSDDLNTSKALALLFDLAKRINKGEEKLKGTLYNLMTVLGFDLSPSNKGAANESNPEAIFELLLEMRESARQARDFALADKIRIGFEKAGYKLKDSPQGTQLIPN